MDPDIADATIARIEAHLAAIEAVLADLATRLDALDEQWDGDAQRAFRVAERAWNKEIRAFQDICAKLQKASHNSVAKFRATEAKMAQAWG